MNQRYRNLLMWALYAALFLFALLIQTMALGRTRFFGVKLDLIPVVVVCVCLFCGHEAGGLFGLMAGCFWFLTGAEDGSLAIVTLTVCGILAGYLCGHVLPRRFGSCLILCLGALLLHEGARFLLQFYLGGAGAALSLWVPVTAGLSLLGCPVIYPLAKVIGKVGGR